MPISYFGLNDINDNPLKNIATTNLDVGEQLSLTLLDVEPSKFYFNSTSDGTYKGMDTGTLFAHYEGIVNDRFGNDDNYFPLLLGITMDDTTLNSSRTVSTCPLLIYIMNQHNDNFKMTFLGFVPTKLPYMDTTLLNILQREGVGTVKKRKQILKFTRKQLQCDYVYDSVKQFLNYQLDGVLLQIGKGTNSVTKKSSPFHCINIW
jgi:hypothetical protein